MDEFQMMVSGTGRQADSGINQLFIGRVPHGESERRLCHRDGGKSIVV